MAFMSIRPARMVIMNVQLDSLLRTFVRFLS